MAVPEITTDRLVLRGWRDTDRDDFAAMNGDPVVMKHFPSLLDRAASDAFLDRIIQGWVTEHLGLWAVERSADARLLGFTGLSGLTFDAHFTPAVEVGWRFRQDAWGHGYATEAATAAVAFAFGDLGLHDLVSFTVPANVASRRVMERLRMTHDPADDFDHPRLPEGHPLRRHVLYRLRRADWEHAQRA